MEFIPVCKPLLPVADKILPYLKKIDSNRYYSNLGPLTVEFETQLANHFNVTRDEVVTSANGTIALVQILKAYNIRSGALCVMPSWTFAATPAAATMAGLNPYFIDIDPKKWCIQPNDVLPLLESHDIGAVIPVASYGIPIDISAWEKFHHATGIPVVIDAAACFDSFDPIHSVVKISTLPFMISLHATKVLGIGEGAVVVTKDDLLAKRIRMNGSFGFQHSRESIIPGINAKISEYTAAVGLAALNEWPEKRKAWQYLTHQFHEKVKNISSVACAPFFNQEWVSCYGLINLKSPFSADYVKQELAKHSVETLSWWGKGCHKHQAYKNCLKGDLSVTEHLSNHVLGLPFWLGLNEDHLSIIFDRLSNVLGEINENTAAMI